jgi:hypothetical protein
LKCVTTRRRAPNACIGLPGRRGVTEFRRAALVQLTAALTDYDARATGVTAMTGGDAVATVQATWSRTVQFDRTGREPFDTENAGSFSSLPSALAGERSRTVHSSVQTHVRWTLVSQVVRPSFAQTPLGT